MSGQMYRELVAQQVQMSLSKWRAFGFKPKPNEQPRAEYQVGAFQWTKLFEAGQMMRIKRRG